MPRTCQIRRHCVSLRDGSKARSTCRFSALNIPMRACLSRPRSSAAIIRASVAVCHSSKILLSFGQLHDVGGGILESDELATIGQGNRILEGAGPVSHAAMTG